MSSDPIPPTQVPEAHNQDSNRTPLEYITIPARNEHTATVIWLHGLGDTGAGMAPLAEEMATLPELGHIKWIAPHARLMPVTGNRGAVMPSWFDCYSFDIPNRAEDEAGLHAAVVLINDLITAEARHTPGVPSSRIVVGGLSQGSAVAILLGLTTRRPLAGVFVLSGYVPLRRRAKEIASPLARTLPIFWAHGRVDQQVAYSFSIQAAEALARDLGVPFNASLERLAPEDLALPSRLTPGDLALLSPSLGNEELPSLGQGDTPGPGLRFLTHGWLGHSVNDTEMKELAVWIARYLPAV